MNAQRVAGVLSLACMAAYLAERLALSDLPGIPMDYFTAGMIAFAVAVLAGRAGEKKDMGGVDG